VSLPVTSEPLPRKVDVASTADRARLAAVAADASTAPRKGSSVDFSNLYERYARDIYRFALFLSGNRSLAEDLTAETFARALVTVDELRVDTVKAYLLAIARNLYRDFHRREGRLVPLAEAFDPGDPAPGPHATTEDRLRLATVLAAMQQLTQSDREALTLACDSEMSYERVAAVLGCSVPAVKVRVHRARVRLKSILNEERP
jgi:RNA polymerase sigma-70 factor, ECF subfamily